MTIKVVETLTLTHEEYARLEKAADLIDCIYEQSNRDGELEKIGYKLQEGLANLFDYESLVIE